MEIPLTHTIHIILTCRIKYFYKYFKGTSNRLHTIHMIFICRYKYFCKFFKCTYIGKGLEHSFYSYYTRFGNRMYILSICDMFKSSLNYDRYNNDHGSCVILSEIKEKMNERLYNINKFSDVWSTWRPTRLMYYSFLYNAKLNSNCKYSYTASCIYLTKIMKSYTLAFKEYKEYSWNMIYIKFIIAGWFETIYT